MSCTVISLPIALAWVVTRVVVAGVAAAKERADNNNETIEVCCDDAQIISEKHFIERSFETPFMDKDLLIKTLTEHGVRGLSENEYGQIKCYTGHYELNFEKMEADKPYFVVIKALDTDDIETKLDDLNNEYAVNVQEESYNNIVARLKENNMQIENEEVCEDNTIVLTVNLE